MNWQAAKDVLGALAAEPRFGLISDMDGTLAPIILHPEDSRPTERNRQLLAELSKLLPLVAVVSGRGAADLAQRVDIPGLVYVGNHGFDRMVGEELQVAPGALAFRPALEVALAGIRGFLEDGAVLEDKGATLTVHYRRHQQPEEFAARARPGFQHLAAELDLKLSEGRMVFELKPPVELDKGTALQDLIEEAQLDAALFLGDDVPDMPALVMARQLREAGKCSAWGVAVQSEEAPEEVAATADFTSSGVEDVEALLAWLLSMRKASST